MLADYKTIASHLLSYGLWKRTTSEYELRDENREWFHRHYGVRYAAHYLDSAASFAQQQIESWRGLGGDTTALPRLRKPIARLNNDLYTIQEMSPDGTIQLRITLAAHESEVIRFRVNHRHFAEWSHNRKGALVILPDGFRLCFTDDSRTPKPAESVAVDLNFDRVTMARSDGAIKEISLKEVVNVQKNHRKKRISVQRTMAHNPTKAERLLAKHEGRERDRVEDRLHKLIHGKNNQFLSFVGNRLLGFEDLRKCTQDVLEDDHGRAFNSKMSSWVHGLFQDIAEHHHEHTKEYYTRGTSRFCPFDNSVLTHPTWKQSRCDKCKRVYDRDWLEAVSGLVRLNSKHKKGEQWKTVHGVLPRPTVRKVKKGLSRAPYSLPEKSASIAKPIRGLPPAPQPEPVRPEWAVLYPEALTVTDVGHGAYVVLGNRVEAADGEEILGTTPRLGGLQYGR